MSSLMHENKVFDKPMLKNLDLECSSLCNLSCNFCPRPTENGKMPIEDIYLTIKEFADMGGETIKPFWRGEPLIDKRMPEILKYAKDCGLKTMLNSNGSWYRGYLNTGLVSIIDILQYTDWLSLSIDEQHGNYFVLADLSTIIIHKKEDAYFEIQSSQYNDVVASICKEYNIPYKVDLPTKRSDNDSESEVITGDRKYCKFPHWRMIVAYNGDCTMCCVDWELENKVGNIYEQSLKDIFYGADADRLRFELMNDIYSSEICKKCPSRSAYQ